MQQRPQIIITQTRITRITNQITQWLYHHHRMQITITPLTDIESELYHQKQREWGGVYQTWLLKGEEE